MVRSLDDVVTAVAAELMAATAGNHVATSQRVLADLVDHFGVDYGFLRHNDHTVRATLLIAEWPPRETVPDPDPIGVVYFADADSVFALIEHRKEPYVLRPEPSNADYQRYIEDGTGVPQTSLAAIPLLSGDLTTGTLGFVKYGDRDWLPEELNALQAIATLLAQLQARIVAEEQLRYLAEHDDLTGLLNRRMVITNLDNRLVEGQPGPVALFFLDLDRLKVISDYLGYDAGDRFLRAFADLLREAVDAEALIARFGGDEFVVVPAEPIEAPAAEASARALQERLRKPIVIDGEVLTRPVSIGVAVGVPGRDSSSDVLRRANQATLFAKSSGGNAVSAFTSEMSENYAIRNDIELHLEQTIASGDEALILHYLPEFDIRTGEMLAAEALLRWQHPTRGLLMPGSFIGIVESINLATKLGRVVMRLACAQVRMWDEHGLGRVLLRVNVSPAQLVTEGFADSVAATLDEFGLDASRLCLEITERVVVRDFDGTRKTFADLKNVGVQIAIDDFGTGYSGLTYLKSLPVDTLKIDKGFVRDLGTNEGDLAIVRSIMALADAFGLDVVAEGVETPAAAKTLLDLGCRRAQGFLFSRPLDGVAMEKLLARRFIELDFLR